MLRKLFITMILICLFIIPVVIIAQSNDLYVSPAGKDTGTCNWISPCNTFWRAESLASPGDVIHLLEGTYDDVYEISKSGTPNAPITITGNNAVLKSLVVSGDYIIVSKIEVIGAVYHGIMTTGSHIIIRDSIVHHSVTDNGVGPVCNIDHATSGWGSGIKVERGSENIVIENNLVYENCGEGIAATMGKNVSIINNTSRDNYSVNIYVDNSSFTTVSDNKVICTGNGYLRDGHRATGIATGEEYYEGWGAQRHDNSIINNLVDGCHEGITSWKPEVADGIEKELIIKDNTVINATHASIALNCVNQNVLIENNTIEIPIYIENTEGVTLLSNIVINPTP